LWFDEENGLLLFPVTSHQKLNVRLENKYKRKITLQMLDVQGQTISTKSVFKYQDVNKNKAAYPAIRFNNFAADCYLGLE